MATHVLWIDTATRRLVTGFNSAMPAETPVFCQGDSVDLELHLLRPLGSLGSLYEETPFPDGGEVQVAIGRIDAKPSLGQFQLAYAGSATAPLPFNASAQAVQTALNTLAPVADAGGLTVQGGNGGPWTLYWNAPGARASLTGDTSLLLPLTQLLVSTPRPGGAGITAIQTIKLKQMPDAYSASWSDQPAPAVVVSKLLAGAPGVNEVQRVRLAPLPHGGTFTLQFGGQTTTPIAFNATASTLQSALTALSSIGADKVAVTDASTGIWDVQFVGTLGGVAQPLLAGQAASLRGFIGKTGTLGLDTPGVEDLLDGRDAAQAVLEVQVRIGGQARTYLQTPCTVLNDMIEGTPMVPPPFTTPATLEQMQAMLDAFVPPAPPPVLVQPPFDAGQITGSVLFDLAHGPSQKATLTGDLFIPVPLGGTEGSTLDLRLTANGAPWRIQFSPEISIPGDSGVSFPKTLAADLTYLVRLRRGATRWALITLVGGFID